MNILIALLFSFSGLAAPEPNLRFQYVPNEGGAPIPCTHERIRDLPDWSVRCAGDGLDKRFAAHVILRESHEEKTFSMEILYWVTQRGVDPHTPPRFHSTTARLHFLKDAQPEVMTLEQGVENDAASLQMEWKRNQ